MNDSVMPGPSTGREPCILVVEDEPALREMLTESLQAAGFQVRQAADAKEARRYLEQGRPHLVLLDWMLPDMSGFDFLRRLRGNPDTRDLPVVMLTAKGEERDRVRGLEAGADDYVVKPFSLRELQARLRTVLRRVDSGDEASVRPGVLAVDVVRHRVTAHGAEVALGPTEFRLLHFLVSHPDRVYSRAQLLDNAWGHDASVEERTVDVQVRRLRKALQPHGMNTYIETVRGFGYRFRVPRIPARGPT